MFNYLFWDLKTLKSGQIVSVEMATKANVKLLRYADFCRYKNGLVYKFRGGYAIESPYQIQVPSDDKWVLVVDLTEPKLELFGQMKVSKVGVITPTTAKSEKLEDVTSSAAEDATNKSTEGYDIFLSFATEDKEKVALPLKAELDKLGIKVWFCETEPENLAVNGLRKEIDSAIYNSKYAVVVLSADYMRKAWTNREFDGITSMEMAKKQIPLCIWHKVTHSDVLKYSPPLANKLAYDTSKYTVQQIAEAFSNIIADAKKGGESAKSMRNVYE